jgi:hypothetical protein
MRRRIFQGCQWRCSVLGMPKQLWHHWNRLYRKH